MSEVVTDSENGADAKSADSQQASGSRIIGKLLPPAVRLWLRSQVDAVEQLQIDLAGRDRQILSGYLPGVSVSAQQVIYQGIQLAEVQLAAKDIRINIGQVVRGKPLRLLKAFPVLGTVVLSADNLNASLSSPLLADGLSSFWRSLVAQPAVAAAVSDRYGALPLSADMMLHRPQVRLSEQRLALSFYPATPSDTSAVPVVLSTVLSAIEGRFLRLSEPRWLEDIAQLAEPAAGLHIESLEGYQWDLGEETQLSHLQIQDTQLFCEGEITVLP